MQHFDPKTQTFGNDKWIKYLFLTDELYPNMFLSLEIRDVFFFYPTLEAGDVPY